MKTVYLNLVQLSGAVNLPRAYMKRLADARKIPFIMAGKRRRFDETEVRKVLTSIADKSIQQMPTQRRRLLGAG